MGQQAGWCDGVSEEVWTHDGKGRGNDIKGIILERLTDHVHRLLTRKCMEARRSSVYVFIGVYTD